MHTALDGGDAVGEGVNGLVVPRVPLQGDFDLLTFLGLVERGHLAEQRLLRRVEVLNEVDDAAVVAEGRLRHRVGALVDKADLQALVQKSHDLHPLDDRLRPELCLVEDGAVGPEGDGGAGPRLARGAVLGGRAGCSDLPLYLAALLEFGLPVLAVPVDLEQEPRREGVHDRDPDAVQPARDLVPLPAELAASVEGGQDDLSGRNLGVLLVRPHGDSPSVIAHPAPAVGEEGHVDPRAVPRHGLVD